MYIDERWLVLRKDQIAIDGPAGVGKSTVARKVAEVLELPFLNTGQLYRALAYLVTVEYCRSASDEDFVVKVAYDAEFDIYEGEVAEVADVNGRWNVLGRLRTDELSAAASTVSGYKGVREALLRFQQLYAEQHGAVMEGRDIGTVILPDAQFKFYLTCDLDERFRRRLKDGNLESVEEMLARDRENSERETAPLKMAADAESIDTTELTIDQVVNKIVDKVRACSY